MGHWLREFLHKLAGRGKWLELGCLAVVVGLSLALKLWQLGEHAFSFDEAIYARLAKHFISQGYSWQFEREVGSAHPPLQIFLSGWSWQLGHGLLPGVAEEALFRLPSVLMGTATVLAIYGIARRYSRFAALAAAAIFAFHPLILFHSRLNEMDIPMLFWLSAGVYFLLRDRGEQHKESIASWHLLLAGFLFGLAALTKIYALAVLVPAWAYCLLLPWYQKKSWRPGLAQGVVVIAATLATAALVSWALAGTPATVYLSFKANYETIAYSVPARWSRQGSFPLLSFLSTAPPAALDELGTLKKSWGIGFLGLSLLGAIRLLVGGARFRLLGVFFIFFLLAFFSIFLVFHWLRYLLVMAGVIIILFAFGAKELWEVAGRWVGGIRGTSHSVVRGGTLALALFVIVISLAPMKELPRTYGVRLVGDVLYGDDLKQAGLFIRDQGHLGKGDWVLSNSHFPIMAYYGDVWGAFYQGFDPPLIKVYRIYDEKARNPAIIDLTWQDEEHLKFIVADTTNLALRDAEVMFDKQVRHSFSLINEPMQDYIASYFTPVAAFGDGAEVKVHKRITRNVYSLRPDPEIWVGEAGAEPGRVIRSNNGFILGSGWGQPYAIAGTGYQARLAKRQGGNFADFLLAVVAGQGEAILEVLYQDSGRGRVGLHTITSKNLQPDGRTKVITRELGQIELGDSRELKLARFTVKPGDYFDVSQGRYYPQQHFIIINEGPPLPAIRLRLVPASP